MDQPISIPILPGCNLAIGFSCHYIGFRCRNTFSTSCYAHSKLFIAKHRHIMRNMSVFINHQGSCGQRIPWLYNHA